MADHPWLRLLTTSYLSVLRLLAGGPLAVDAERQLRRLCLAWSFLLFICPEDIAGCHGAQLLAS